MESFYSIMESFYTSQVCSITVLLGISIGLQQYCGHEDQTAKHNSTAATGGLEKTATFSLYTALSV